MDKEQARQECLHFLKSQEYAVIATVSKEGAPEAATVSFSVNDNFDMYFATRHATRKFKNLENNQDVALVVGTGPGPVTVQIQGTAQLLDGEEQEQAMVEFLTSKMSYYDVFLKLPGFDLAAFKVTPYWIRMLNADAIRKEEKYIQVL